jgi:hypothetical protein
MSERSRIDDKIKRDDMMKEELDDTWEALDTRIKEAIQKLNANFFTTLTSKLNDGNSLIRVVSGELTDNERAVPGASRRTIPQLEIRLDREQKKIIARRTDDDSSPRIYPIKADLSSNSLRFVQGDNLFTPLMLAEILLSQLVGINLDS